MESPIGECSAEAHIKRIKLNQMCSYNSPIQWNILWWQKSHRCNIQWLHVAIEHFQSVCPPMKEDKRHMEASWWEASWLLSFRQRWIHAPHSQKCTLIEPCSLIAGSFDSDQRLSCFLFSVNPHDSLRKVYSSSHFINEVIETQGR